MSWKRPNSGSMDTKVGLRSRDNLSIIDNHILLPKKQKPNMT
jgi:hypothetical protein